MLNLIPILVVPVMLTIVFSQASGIFLLPPQNETTYLNSFLPFKCQGTNTSVIYTWYINGSAVMHPPPPGINIKQKGSLSTMTVHCSEDRNMSQVQCAYRHSNGSWIMSNKAIAKIQGHLGPVTNLTAHLTADYINMTWIPPFSLNISYPEVSHNFNHTVEVYRNSAGGKKRLIKTFYDVIESYFSVSPENFNLTDWLKFDTEHPELNFGVHAVNGAGNGKWSLIRVDLSELEDLVSTPASTTFDNSGPHPEPQNTLLYVVLAMGLHLVHHL